jgi:hypothetical protein
LRTLIIIIGGFALWAICLGIAKQTADSGAQSMTAATIVFLILWFLAAPANMAIGVYRAGYSFPEELPIFLLVYTLPTFVAVFVKWKFL